MLLVTVDSREQQAAAGSNSSWVVGRAYFVSKESSLKERKKIVLFMQYLI